MMAKILPKLTEAGYLPMVRLSEEEIKKIEKEVESMSMKWMTPEKEMKLKIGFNTGKIASLAMEVLGVVLFFMGAFAIVQSVPDGMAVVVMGVVMVLQARTVNSLLETDMNAVQNEKRVDYLTDRIAVLEEQVGKLKEPKAPVISANEILRVIPKVFEQLSPEFVRPAKKRGR